MTLIIIGTGLGGYQLAREWRKYNSTTPLLMFTKDTGAAYSKPALSLATSYKNPPPNLVLADQLAMQHQLNACIMPATTIEQIDPVQCTVSTDQQTYSYTQLVLATGATPLGLGAFSNDLYYTVNNLVDYQKLVSALSSTSKVTIIGSGLIGCEFANALHMQGYSVEIITRDKWPLNQTLPEQFGKKLLAVFAERGIPIYTEQTIQSILKTPQGLTITANNQHRITPMVLAATGLGVDLTLAKLTTLTYNKGIIVDDYLQTSSPNIFALGDCAEIKGQVRGYIMPLLASARSLAKTLVGMPTALEVPVVWPITVKTPYCPILIALPGKSIPNAVWEIHDCVALYKQKERIIGCILMQEATKERAVWLEKIVPFIEAK